jgi:hypothetical protein
MSIIAIFIYYYIVFEVRLSRIYFGVN